MRFGKDANYSKALNYLAEICIKENQILKAEGLLRNSYDVSSKYS